MVIIALQGKKNLLGKKKTQPKKRVVQKEKEPTPKHYKSGNCQISKKADKGIPVTPGGTPWEKITTLLKKKGKQVEGAASRVGGDVKNKQIQGGKKPPHPIAGP